MEPTPTTQAEPTFFSRLKDLGTFHWKELLVIGITLMIVVQWNMIRDLKKNLEQSNAKVDTMQGQFAKLGDAYTTQNKLFADQHSADKAAQDALGAQVTDAMAQQGAKLNGLYSSVGQIKGQLAGLTGAVTDNGFTSKANGSFDHAHLEQNRQGAPPLTSLDLTYDASNPDKNKAFTGIWTNYSEKFTTTLGTWTTDKEGYRAAIRTYREIYKPDPLDPTKEVLVGKEEIPQDSATATFAPQAFHLLGASSVPRWTLTPGVYKSWSTNQIRPAAILDYRITNTVGASVGQFGSDTFLGVSWRFGATH